MEGHWIEYVRVRVHGLAVGEVGNRIRYGLQSIHRISELTLYA